MLEGEVTEGLEDHRSGCPDAQVVSLGNEDHPAPSVSHRPGRPRHSLYPFHGEPVVGSEIGQVFLGRRPFAGVPGGSQTGSRFDLDFGEVVVEGSHLGTERDVRHPGTVSGLQTGQAGTGHFDLGQSPVEADQSL